MDARFARWLAPLALGLAATAAAAADGLNIRPDSVDWPRWQARLGVTTAGLVRADLSPTTQLQSARLLGDYYFTGPGFGAGQVTGGLRATSGVFAGARGSAVSTPTLPARQGSAFTLSAHQAAANSADGAPDSFSTPYLGVGYTGMSLRGGWGFTADIGLMALAPSVRFGRAPSTGQNVDELLRDLRLTPVLQLGVSYSF